RQTNRQTGQKQYVPHYYMTPTKKGLTKDFKGTQFTHPTCKQHQSIVCKFSFFGDSNKFAEVARTSEERRSMLRNNSHRKSRQKDGEKQVGKQAWVSYDTLYVDRRPIKDS
ncbi:hypothetical protein DPMN_114605, partial [Dreissena polymorpha]